MNNNQNLFNQLQKHDVIMLESEMQELHHAIEKDKTMVFIHHFKQRARQSFAVGIMVGICIGVPLTAVLIALILKHHGA